MATWRELLEAECRLHGDVVDELFTTFKRDEMDVEFHEGFGSPNGVPFTAWSKTRVYFPVVYDGAESVGSAPRFECAERTRHVGGW